MTRNKFTTNPVVRNLNEAETGSKLAIETCRVIGINKSTFYAWKAEFGGLDIGESKRDVSLHLGG